MIISSPGDYRAAAKSRLPRFLFDYIEGGAGREQTLDENETDLAQWRLKQRVLRDVSDIDTRCSVLGQHLKLPVVLAPVGLSGMYARRGEVQAARAAQAAGIPYTLSTVSVCPLAEVAAAVPPPTLWFQLYVLKDRAFMRDVLDRARALGITTLVFTVDMPLPGSRYRDAHSGLTGPHAARRRFFQILSHPRWAFDVGLRGKPHDLGNISAYRGQHTGLLDYIAFLAANFDPSITWKDLQWIRDSWSGKLIIKGILDPDDAREAVAFGADGIVVSNHGGRQLDGAPSSARALPAIADAVKGRTALFADSGIRSGLDVLRLLALGADAVLLGRAYIYALATDGEAGVSNLLQIIEKEMRTAMSLNGCRTLAEIDRGCLL